MPTWLPTSRTTCVSHFSGGNCIVLVSLVVSGGHAHPTTRVMQFHLGNRMTRVSLIAFPAAHMHNRQSTKYTLHGNCTKYFESGSAMRTSTQGLLRSFRIIRDYLWVSRNTQDHQESSWFIQDLLESCGTISDNLGTSGVIWDDLKSFSIVRTHVGSFGFIQSHRGWSGILLKKTLFKVICRRWGRRYVTRGIWDDSAKNSGTSLEKILGGSGSSGQRRGHYKESPSSWSGITLQPCAEVLWKP